MTSIATYMPSNKAPTTPGVSGPCLYIVPGLHCIPPYSTPGSSALPEKYGRIHRLLKIITLIQAETGWNAKKLASECSTSERNVYRDMEMLEGAGIPYYFDELTKGYGIRRDFFMPPVDLTFEEALALIVLAGQIGEKEQIPFTKAAARVVAKVRGQLPDKIRKELSVLDENIEMQLARASSEEGVKDVYDHVRNAIANRRALTCSYESLANRDRDDGDPEVFEFKPYRLYFDQRAWYAIGFHGNRDEVRCLRLSRFTQIKPTDKPYNIPDDFSMEERRGKAWRMIKGDTTYQIVLHFDKEFAETVSDTYWHATQVIEWQDDDSIIFRCEVDGLDEIVWWILSMGPHCVVIEPPELVDRVKRLAGEILSHYDGQDSVSAK
jgi:predicted DNA-binding transcriptional regulator YafY